jgi:hypothetical protein
MEDSKIMWKIPDEDLKNLTEMYNSVFSGDDKDLILQLCDTCVQDNAGLIMGFLVNAVYHKMIKPTEAMRFEIEKKLSKQNTDLLFNLSDYKARLALLTVTEQIKEIHKEIKELRNLLSPEVPPDPPVPPFKTEISDEEMSKMSDSIIEMNENIKSGVPKLVPGDE